MLKFEGMNNTKGKNLKIITVTNCDINNGPGFRMTVWVAGCTHNCYACQNKHTHSYVQGRDLYKKIDDRGDVMDKIFYEFELYKHELDGITLSGGDPLDQSDNALSQLQSLLDNFKNKFPTKTIWLYTGCVWEDFSKAQMEVARMCDVVVDGKFDYYKRDITLPFRGSSNQRLIDVKRSLKELHAITLDDEKFKS